MNSFAAMNASQIAPSAHLTSSAAPAAARRLAGILAAVLLIAMAALMFSSSWDDAATSDDSVAIISGYSYLRMRDYRLEPQNPPLMEDLAAFPLLFMELREPWSSRAWEAADDPALGQEFLYLSGNDPDAILRVARAPMILFTLAFGGVLFWWTRKKFGDAVALLTLFFYVFSPTVVAHGRFAATDLGATAGFFVGIVSFLRFLKNPTGANVLLAGLALGFALLTKFSTVALLPLFLVLAAAWVIVHHRASRCLLRRKSLPPGRVVLTLRAPDATLLHAFRLYALRTLGVIALGFVVVYPLYLHHTWSYPPETQRVEAEKQREIYQMGGTAKDIVLWASDKPLLRPYAQYFLGLLVALKASRWGQPIFFLGEIQPSGVWFYFPFVYLVKEPLALHLLTLAVLAFVFARAGRLWPPGRGQRRAWLSAHFTECAFLLVIAVYWAALIRSNMNIGVRHLLPAYPFTFILVAAGVVALYRKARSLPVRRVSVAALAALLVWQAVTVLRVHPSYVAYFNEVAGGPDGGWRYVNDSNLDWGQDVKRLAQFAEARGLSALHASTFGPADPGFYLEGVYRGPVDCFQPPQGWVAVSAMIYSGAPWDPECDYRRTLPPERLAAKVGYSIFVFYLD